MCFIFSISIDQDNEKRCEYRKDVDNAFEEFVNNNLLKMRAIST